jgi:hypothetical protein
MAMGIFDQLAWLTTRVKRLCCAIKVGAYQSPAPIDLTSITEYTLTEGGVYVFDGSPSSSISLFFQDPTSAGQKMTLMFMVPSSVLFYISVAPGSTTCPFFATTQNSFCGSVTPPAGEEIWEFVSISADLPFVGSAGYVWVGYKVYPYL